MNAEQRTQDEAALQSAEMSVEELAEAKRYGRQSLVCALADKALDLAVMAVIALMLARPLDDWLQRFSLLDRWWSLRLVAFYLAIMALHVLVSLPLSYHSGYVLEHRYGLSTLRFARWLWRYTKVLLLAVPFGGVMFLGLYWIIWTCGPYWWLVGAGAFFLVSVLLARIWPVLIEPLFYTIERLDNPELEARMARLAEGTGLSIEGVYRLALSEETVKANAQLAGLGRPRRVLLGDTLLDRFTPDEIEVILAHEIGHHVFHHIRKLILGGLVSSVAGFWICDRLLAIWVGAGAGPLDYTAMPVYALPMLMLILAVFRTVLEPLENAISRHYERQCDRYALDRTGLRQAYLAAFKKLARQNKDDPSPPRLEVILFHSHPPIAERLAMAEDRAESTATQ
jgi:STE24 endopeptidase